MLIHFFKANSDGISTGVGLSQDGILATTLQQGPASDGYSLTISVKIIDSVYGVTEYTLPDMVKVSPNLEYLSMVLAPNFTREILFEGKPEYIFTVIIFFSVLETEMDKD